MAPGGPSRGGYPDEDRLPWLQEAPDETRTVTLPILPIVLALVAIGVVLGLGTVAWRWWRDQPAADGTVGLIQAPPGPYKVKPDDPGGMAVEGEGFASYQASEGADPNAVLNLSAVPEAPVAKHKPAAATATAPAPVSASAPPPVETVGTGSIQLGAFSTEGKANAAWKALAARFRFLAPFTPVVLPAKAGTGTGTIYRLRANVGTEASDICGRLKVAGETCMVVGG